MSIYKADYQQNRFTSELLIRGYRGDLQELTKSIGLTPTRTINVGEKCKPLAPPAKESLWEYQIIAKDIESPDEILAKLVETIYPVKEKLGQLLKECDVCLAVAATEYHYNQKIFLSPEFLSKLSDINVRLWFDIYCLDETYLEKVDQQKAFVARLQKSKSAKKLGIATPEEIQAVTQALHIYEKNKDVIYEDLFPDYAGGEPATEEDTNNSLLLAREKLVELHDAIEKSDFLMSKAKDNPIK